jgi:hypothetical protein
MKLSSRIVAFAGAALMLAGSVMGSHATAATTADAKVTITSTGTLTASITGADFGSTAYSFGSQTLASKDIVITAADDRGTGEGWNVTLSSGDFMGDDYDPSTNPLHTFAVSGNLTFGAGTTAVDAGNSGTGAGKITSTAINPSASTVKLWQAFAGYGDGHYTLTVPATLTIPARTVVDSYTATMTIGIASAP